MSTVHVMLFGNKVQVYYLCGSSAVLQLAPFFAMTISIVCVNSSFRLPAVDRHESRAGGVGCPPPAFIDTDTLYKPLSKCWCYSHSVLKGHYFILTSVKKVLQVDPSPLNQPPLGATTLDSGATPFLCSNSWIRPWLTLSLLGILELGYRVPDTSISQNLQGPLSIFLQGRYRYSASLTPPPTPCTSVKHCCVLGHNHPFRPSMHQNCRLPLPYSTNGG